MDISNSSSLDIKTLIALSKALDISIPKASDLKTAESIDPILSKIRAELTRLLGDKLQLSEALKDPKTFDALKNDLPKLESLFNSESLKKLVTRSGIQFEHQLSLGKINQQDLKAQLLKLADTIPALKAVINQITEQQLRVLMPSESQPQTESRIEIALLTPNQSLQNFSFNFFKEYQHETERSADIFEFETQFEHLGGLQGRLSHSDALLDIRLWFSNPSTHKSLSSKLDEMREHVKTHIHHNNIRIQLFIGHRNSEAFPSPGQFLYQKT